MYLSLGKALLSYGNEGLSVMCQWKTLNLFISIKSWAICDFFQTVSKFDLTKLAGHVWQQIVHGIVCEIVYKIGPSGGAHTISFKNDFSGNMFLYNVCAWLQ
jgi:hypothetical protein